MTFSNTTPLFAFSTLGAFDLLRMVHGHLHIVETVVAECEVGGPIAVPDLRTLRWITIEPAPIYPDPRFYMLDAGERVRHPDHDTYPSNSPRHGSLAGKTTLTAGWRKNRTPREIHTGNPPT